MKKRGVRWTYLPRSFELDNFLTLIVYMYFLLGPCEFMAILYRDE